jgi:hypothetical protein
LPNEWEIDGRRQLPGGVDAAKAELEARGRSIRLMDIGELGQFRNRINWDAIAGGLDDKDDGFIVDSQGIAALGIGRCNFAAIGDLDTCQTLLTGLLGSTQAALVDDAGYSSALGSLSGLSLSRRR